MRVLLLTPVVMLAMIAATTAVSGEQLVVNSGEPQPRGNNNCEYANGLVQLCPGTMLYNNGVQQLPQVQETHVSTPVAPPATTPPDPTTPSDPTPTPTTAESTTTPVITPGPATGNLPGTGKLTLMN